MSRSDLDALNWDTLVILIPELNTVLLEIQGLKIDKKVSIRQAWRCYKEIMVSSVGFGAPENAPAISKTSKAYDIAYEKLYNALGRKYNIPFQPMVRDSYCEE